ncbi:hypothetical protein ACDW34_11305 [Acinetobacter piscicola]|uniref:hypothetical protein n=1 Tax=Acinetobacter piscicola TaxID=2006115 RepID=UPI00355702C9
MVRKISKQIACNWVNESISEESLMLLNNLKIDHENFIAKFQKMIGRYRSFKEFNDTAPMPKETIDHLSKILRQIEALQESISLIPSDAHAWNTEAIVLNMLDYEYYQCLIDHKMIQHLTKYSIVLMYSQDKTKLFSNQKGRNKNWQENKLIYETFMLINQYEITPLKAKESYQFISEFLISNGVNVPIEAENIGKIINQIKRLKNDT